MPRCADTMIGLKRLDSLQFCVETAIREDTEGDFIETGVWRGGACIFMRAVLVAYAIKNRKVRLQIRLKDCRNQFRRSFPLIKVTNCIPIYS